MIEILMKTIGCAVIGGWATILTREYERGTLTVATKVEGAFFIMATTACLVLR